MLSHSIKICLASCAFLTGTQSLMALEPRSPLPPATVIKILANMRTLHATAPDSGPRNQQSDLGVNPQRPVPRLSQQSPPTSGDESKFMNTIEHVFDAQDTYWPLGTQSSVHIQPQTDDGLHRWVPFISLSQDADEVDAHVRNGIGAGATYRFNKNARVDVEGMFLQHSGDENPALRDESRAMVVFSFSF